MKKKPKIILIIVAVIIVLLIPIGLVTSYIDIARVRNSIEPKYTIKIVTDGGNKVTYWGFGYKVVRYPAVSPKEKFKSSLGVKFGSWFMNYKLSEYDNIEIELLDEGKIIKVSRTRDIEFIVSLLRDSKYINELCEGINTHKIKVGNNIYYLKESCKEIQKGKKQAEISDKDLKKLIEIINYYEDNDLISLLKNKMVEEKVLIESNLEEFEILSIYEYGYYKSEPNKKYIEFDFRYTCKDQSKDCITKSSNMFSTISSDLDYNVIWAYTDGKKIYELSKGVSIGINDDFVFSAGEKRIIGVIQ